MKDFKDTSLLILAGGERPFVTGLESQLCPISLLNVGTTLCAQRILKAYSHIDFQQLTLAADQQSKFLYSSKAFENIDVKIIDKCNSVIDSLYESLHFIDTEHCLINPITSIPAEHSSLPNNHSIFYSKKLLPRENWSGISYSEDNYIVEFISKLNDNQYGIDCYPFTGRFFGKTSDIQNCIVEIKGSDKQDLQFLVQLLYAKYSYELIHVDWIDAGHSSTYADAKVLSLTSRYFNSLSCDLSKGKLTKNSKNTAKLINEALYYQNIPPHLCQYFPDIFDHRPLGKNQYQIILEYIPMPSLAEHYLFNKIGILSWKRIIERLNQYFIDAYESNTCLAIASPSFLYGSKAQARINELMQILEKSNNSLLRMVSSSSFIVNNNMHLPSLVSILQSFMNDIKRYDSPCELFFGHGDLCFNNILAEPLSRQIKLIDPKADFNSIERRVGLVDKRYDLAKLNHSVTFLYDAIVNDLFYLKCQESSKVEFFLYKPYLYDKIKALFKDIMFQFRVSETDLQLITANLFFSMLPLHQENHEKVAAFAIMGMLIYTNNSLSIILDQ